MSTTISYCANGCTVRSDGRRVRAQTTPPSKLCSGCEDNLEKWLREIPDHYALLPTFATPGSVEKNPEERATKAAFVNPPIRVEVIDLLDSRIGRIWNGTAPSHDRRGVLGTLLAMVEEVVDKRPLPPPANVTVTSACELLRRHKIWIAEQDWALDLFTEVKQLHRDLSNAVGLFRRPPVGRCHLIPEDNDKPCGGPLHPNDWGGVRCTRCYNTWNADELRILGRALSETEETA